MDSMMIRRAGAAVLTVFSPWTVTAVCYGDCFSIEDVMTAEGCE